MMTIIMRTITGKGHTKMEDKRKFDSLLSMERSFDVFDMAFSTV